MADVDPCLTWHHIIDWMHDKTDLVEAIPPAYTEHIGAALIEQIGAVAA